MHPQMRTSMLIIMVHYSWSPLTSITLVGDENGHFLSLGWLSPKKHAIGKRLILANMNDGIT